jgi:uncharacterized protein (DUF305 family)
MKKLALIFPVFLFMLSACNDNGRTTSESGSNDTLQKTSDNTIATNDSAGSASNGSSIMNSMMKHMDEMKNMKSMNDPDHDFAMMMKHHHMAAKEMAQIEVSQGHHNEVKVLAQKMSDDQSKEISEIDNFLSNIPAENKPGNDKFHHEVKQMMSNMPMNMEQSGKDVDQQFVSMMISHHDQAIDMSEMYLKYGKKQEMRSLADKIIKAQSKEIKDLKDLQAKSH